MSHPTRYRRRPQLESLEDRTLPSTFTVTNLFDSGLGSLRAAIAAANVNPGADVINFASPFHGTIALTTGQLSVTDALTINGPGAGKLTVSGNDASRVFDIGAGTTVTIVGLTISHGRADTTGGGGIRNKAGATLSLDHDTLSSNQAVGVASMDEFGGGLLNLGHATITACWFTNNQALGGGSFDAIGGSAGGAIDNFGGASLTVADSLFTNNRAVSADGAGYFALGGAIENNAGLNGFDPTQATPSTAILTRSTFLDNLAQGGAQASTNGGAILSEGLGTSMTLTGCLIDGNRSVGGEGGANNAVGGGIQNIGIMEMDGCTITNNQAVGGKNGAITTDDPLAGSAFGGGIENNFQAVLHITNSLIAGNLAQGGASATGPGSDAFGGGISNSPNASMTVTSSLILNNSAIGGQSSSGGNNVPAGFGIGGGIDNSGGSTATLIGSIIAGNLAQGSAGGAGNQGGDGVGGGLAVGAHILVGLTDNSQLTVSSCIIVGNQALGGKGGAGAKGGDGLGGGFAIFARSSATVSGSSWSGNNAQGGNGGAGGNGGNGQGGGAFIGANATATLLTTNVNGNSAVGGRAADGGSDGQGEGGGLFVDPLAMACADLFTQMHLRGNHATTLGDDLFGSLSTC